MFLRKRFGVPTLTLITPTNYLCTLATQRAQTVSIRQPWLREFRLSCSNQAAFSLAASVNQKHWILADASIIATTHKTFVTNNRWLVTILRNYHSVSYFRRSRACLHAKFDYTSPDLEFVAQQIRVSIIPQKPIDLLQPFMPFRELGIRLEITRILDSCLKATRAPKFAILRFKTQKALPAL